MNLNAIANGVVKAVSPNILLSIQVSTGNTTSPDGTRVPSFAPAQPAYGQVQPLSYREIQQADSLNLGGTRKTIYINSFVDGLLRPENKGGDLITVAGGPDAGVYLVANIDEAWINGWCKAICTLQNGS